MPEPPCDDTINVILDVSRQYCAIPILVYNVGTRSAFGPWRAIRFFLRFRLIFMYILLVYKIKFCRPKSFDTSGSTKLRAAASDIKIGKKCRDKQGTIRLNYGESTNKIKAVPNLCGLGYVGFGLTKAY